MSIVLYGGISMKLVRTNRYTCIPQYSADGMDYLYTVHRYELTCIFNPAVTSYRNIQGIPIAAAGQSPVNTMTAIRHALLQPRQPLYIEHGAGQDTPLIVSPQRVDALSTYPCDAYGGPFPRGVYVVGLDNDKTWLVNWTVETALVECPGTFAADSLLSNRFSQTSVVDSAFMTTLTTQGRAEFRTDVLEKMEHQADQFRQRVLPPIPTGFKRERIVVAVDSRRNALTYEVVDRETYFDLGDNDPRQGGSGALEVEGTYRVAGLRAEGGVMGGMTQQSVDIRIRGQKTSSQKKLLELAVLIAMNKLPIAAAGGQSFIVQAGVSQSLTDPSMALSITMQVPPKPAGKANVPILDADGLLVERVFAAQNGLNPAPPHDGGTRGFATNTIVAAKLRAACTDPKKPEGVGPASTDDGPAYDGSSGPDVEVYEGSDPVLPPTPTKYSLEQQQFAYDDYHFDVQYETDSGRMAVPLGGPVGEGGYVSGGGGGGSSDDEPDMAFLTLSRPTTHKIVQGTASRIGKPPTLPKAESADRNLCLLKRRITAAAPEILPDGQTAIYRVSFWYQYAMKRSPKPADDLLVGLIPVFTPDYAAPSITASQFQGGLIGPDVPTDITPVGADA